MLEIKADFRGKEPNLEPKSCVIDKIIRLSGAEYDSFARNMLRDWAFIRDNFIDTVVDSEGRYHCLLITGDGRRDGILVNPEGSNCARYSAFIPNAADFLTMNRYPALAALNQRLIGVVDDIAGQIEAVPFGQRSEVDLRDLETRHGIDLLTNGVLRDAVLDMLADRLDAPDFELDKSKLVVHPTPDRPRADEKASVLEQIKEARQTSQQSKAHAMGMNGTLGNNKLPGAALSFDDFVVKCRMMDEACRQWCAFIDEAPERRDGEMFTEFFADICKQKYDEYLSDPGYRADCNYTAEGYDRNNGEKDVPSKHKDKGGSEL